MKTIKRTKCKKLFCLLNIIIVYFSILQAAFMHFKIFHKYVHKTLQSMNIIIDIVESIYFFELRSFF